MKLVFLGTSSSIIYFMRYHRFIKLTYDRDQDTFRYIFLVLPSFALACMTSHNYKPLEVGVQASGWAPWPLELPTSWGFPMLILLLLLQVIWTFSIYLEAVAILPQLVLLQRTQNIDNLTGNYVFLLG